MRILAARWCYQIVLGTFLKEGVRAPAPFGRQRQIHRCPRRLFKRLLHPESSTLPHFAACCCRDGSLADIKPLWVQETSGCPPMSERTAKAYTCAHPTSNTDTSVEWNCSTLLPSQSSPSVSIHRLLAWWSAYIRQSFWLPPRGSLLSRWSVVITASQIGLPTKTRVRDGSIHTDLRWLQRVNKLLTVYRSHTGAIIDWVRSFRTMQEVQRRDQEMAFTSIERYHLSNRLVADYRLLVHRLRNKLGTLARRVEDC